MTDRVSASSSGGCTNLMTKPLPLVGLGTVFGRADARERLAQLRARGPQPPVRRVQVDLQRLGGLGHRQLLDVDQHDDRALVLVERIEQPIEQRDRLAARDQLGGPGRRRRHHLDDRRPSTESPRRAGAASAGDCARRASGSRTARSRPTTSASRTNPSGGARPGTRPARRPRGSSRARRAAAGSATRTGSGSRRAAGA